MHTSFRNNTNGQVLVQVAIAFVVLIGFLAIAIDVGLVYAERRYMQNAADAGALAGARELCFGAGTQDAATIAAEKFAETSSVNRRNETQTANVSFPEPHIVSVVVSEEVNLFFGSVINIANPTVQAEAQAACGRADNMCNVWPITFHVNRWQEIPCGAEFFVWNDNSLEGFDCTHCLCQWQFPPDNMVYAVGPGARGWVLLPTPAPPYPNPGCGANCGNQVDCWLEHGYTGNLPITYDLTGSICLPGQPGVGASAEKPINDSIGQIRNILLWDGEIEKNDSCKIGTCPGDLYHVIGAGCIEVLGYEKKLDLPENPLNPPEPPNKCANNVKAVKARKLCDCDSSCGSTGGAPVPPGQIGSVSLIK